MRFQNSNLSFTEIHVYRTYMEKVLSAFSSKNSIRLQPQRPFILMLPSPSIHME